MRKILLIMICGFSWFQTFGQEKTVTGTVTSSEDKLAIPGVNIMVKGTTTGTITDISGNYTIKATPESILVFSAVGFISEEVKVANQSAINVILAPDIKQLGEVVVMGYGTQKKSDVIGSVASVKSKELTKVPSPSFETGLQGLATGVSVSTNSGAPGAGVSIKVRGVNSITTGTDPLWIIDGMPMYSGGGLEKGSGAPGQSPMSLINPNDIESIEILKDAKATAIYGSRGSNGVILITTKSGKKGKATTTLDYSMGVSNMTKSPEDIGFTNTSEWFGLVDQAIANSATSAYNTNFAIGTFKDNPLAVVNADQARNINTNWFDQILRQGSFTDVNVSSSNGFEKGSFYLSGNYRKDKGVIINNDLERVTFRANLDFEPTKNLRAGARMNFAYSQNDKVRTREFQSAQKEALPWFPIYNFDHPSGYWNPMSTFNLAANIDEDNRIDKVDQYRGIGNLFAEYAIPFVKGLSLRAEGGFDLIQNNSMNWQSAFMRDQGSYAVERAATRKSFNYNLYSTFVRTLGDHSFNVVVGTESQRTTQYQREMEGQKLRGSYKQIGNPGQMISMSGSLNFEDYLRSYFSRADYKFKDRYLIGLSFRTDGSSRFASANRWGSFKAFSAGWIVNEESFLENVEVISLLKIRGSFGQTGNNNIDRFLPYTTTTTETKWRYGVPELLNAATRPNNIGNKDIQWETTNSYDVGVDYGILNNRISGSVAYFYQYVEDLILTFPVPPSVGVDGGDFTANIGDMTNSGLEISINTVNLDKENFRWRSDFNLTTNQNKVVKLTPEIDEAGGFISKDDRYYRKGDKLQMFRMAMDAGVDPERGVDMIWEMDIDHYNATGETIKTGRAIPATNQNLATNFFFLEDKTPIPTFFGGFNNTFEYKGFDLSLLITYSGGNYLYDYDMQRGSAVQYGQMQLRKDLIGNTWTEDNRNAKYPELRFNNTYDWSWNTTIENANSPTGKGDWVNDGKGNYNNESYKWTKYLFKGDYIRLRNVQLGYNLSREVTERLKLQGVRVYLTGTNLFTWTKEYQGWDPETGGDNFPQLKIYSVGASVKF